MNETKLRIVGETDDAPHARPPRASGRPESRYTFPFSARLLFLPQYFDDLECINTFTFRGTVVDKAFLFPSRDSEPRLLAPQISRRREFGVPWPPIGKLHWAKSLSHQHVTLKIPPNVILLMHFIIPQFYKKNPYQK